MKPASDLDTIVNADDLWRLVHAVQERIGKDGTPIMAEHPESQRAALASLRMMADELDPENGRD
jgi:hypothetical protein